MKKGMTLKQHAEQARRIREMINSLMVMRATAWEAYPLKGRMSSRFDAAEKALTRLRSELEESFYKDHPSVAPSVGFPHYHEDALKRLEQKAEAEE